ncbi:PREDICTED: SET and MYND domain-containing protein 5 [Dufourea novaeangliae]|uniref:SET and MYND domain-containing protein 5 n=1 Tax=Dufourea novaeangliae TaxID=178035 RepID=A0A154PH54_DUFNO|nr:PREDICTED: SET and MYND domain-containing protein 5 [Dufourea novaeangliae]KZC10510.1 SET and MYND domain-containing protein 5 [Dufourea novaeangliae]
MNSNDFDIRLINEEKGKGIFATGPFKVGDVILKEKPIVSCQLSWNLDYGYLACDNCLKPLETAEENVHRLTGNKMIFLPHAECCETKTELITQCSECDTKYCSIECQNEAYLRYHKTLCLREKHESHPLVQLNETWKNMHYPPETGTIMLFARMVALVNQANNKDDILSIFSKFCHSNFCTDDNIHQVKCKLMEEKFIGQFNILRQMMQKALNTEFTSHWFTPHGFKNLIALVGTNAQGIGTSAFSRWVKNVSALDLPREERIDVDKLIDRIYDEMEEEVGSFLNNEGTGLYVLQSALNHSCVPNAVVEFPFSNNVLVVRAIRDIQPEEEICISYLDECDLERSRHSRQKTLSLLYMFTCRCDKCMSQVDDPDLTSEKYHY